MSSHAFSLHNPSDLLIENGFFCLGVPVSKGQWLVTDPVSVVTSENKPVKCHCEPVTLWEDGSVQWFRISGYKTVEANHTDFFDIIDAKESNAELVSPVAENENNINIRCADTKIIKIHKDSCGHIEFANARLKLLLTLEGSEITANFESSSFHVKYSHSFPLLVEVNQTGYFEINNAKRIDIALLITMNVSNGDSQFSIRMRNPDAAKHIDGKWDLGDPNSVFIQFIGFSVEHPFHSLKIEHDSEFETLPETFLLHQASSGFDNWNSANHVDHTGSVNLPFKGYTFGEGTTGDRQGLRATPELKSDDFYLAIDKFWENFPASISRANKETVFTVLGASRGPATELQPGEQKTRQFSFSRKPGGELISTLSISWLTESNVLPFITESLPSHLISSLIKKGVTGQDSFFNKRKEIDEFGWRHFGELYADHERALSPETKEFISHYNNQYDPLYGCLSQWLQTGSNKWFELADNLANHVADIDVYHTLKDKPEYSQGLFWHTDHYVQACTATHRTYSDRQPGNVYQDHAGGGGPGGQHCYTNGLLLHYLITGNRQSKDALLSICSWIENYYEGDGSLLGFLLGVKKSGTADLKNVRTGRYPLDRGTGNYLQALMDKYVLTGCYTELEKCARIIFNTVGPDDDLEERNLSNVEETWFYTVFFQAVCRFVQMKEQLGENDASYAHAVKSLKLYALWMLDNEYAYLDKPDILEFPNQTWSGQDLRKICVLLFAANYFDCSKQAALKEKADELEKIVLSRLENSNESTTTRVLCLMMQNGNYRIYGAIPKPMKLKENYPEYSAGKSRSLFQEAFKVLRTFSIKNERQQMLKRFPELEKWLGKP